MYYHLAGRQSVDPCSKKENARRPTIIIVGYTHGEVFTPNDVTNFQSSLDVPAIARQVKKRKIPSLDQRLKGLFVAWGDRPPHVNRKTRNPKIRCVASRR